jgi:membrane protein required for colicin V production
VNATGLSGTDRLLGFLFGSFRGIILCIVILIGLRPFSETAEWWRESIFIPQLAAFEGEVLQLFGRASSTIEELSNEL